MATFYGFCLLRVLLKGLNKLQALRVFYKAEGGPVAEVTEVARNAVSVQWYPNSNPGKKEA